MNLEQFDKQFGHLKDVDKIAVDPLCDHPKHVNANKDIGRGPARRNILKNGKAQFICRACYMKHDNPMNKTGPNRQTNEIITVICPNPHHIGDKGRQMPKAHYYGEMKEPYEQVCIKCAQRGKAISQEQKDQISETLSGRKLTEEHKRNIGIAFHKDPKRKEQALKNLEAGRGSGWNKGKETPQEVKDKQSAAHKGKKKSLSHRQNISKGRKKAIAAVGGFTLQHRANLSRGTQNAYDNGFNPKTHHCRGWHESDKAGRIPFRSSYEKRAFMLLDDDNNVVHYEYEKRIISYYNPVKKNKCTYRLDLIVTYKDGSVKWIEVKPKQMTSDPVNRAKIKAAKAAAKKRGCGICCVERSRVFWHRCHREADS
jgi:hypothetical protein